MNYKLSFAFTAFSAFVLLGQQFYLNSIINEFKKENSHLSHRIKIGCALHKKIIEQKDLENKAALANLQYAYSVDKPVSEEFAKGYEEGYHNAIKNMHCPNE